MAYPVIGIDFGATSCVAAVANAAGETRVIAGEEDGRTPAVVYFPADGGTIVGAAAAEAALLDPDRAIAHVRGLLANPAWHFEVDRADFAAVDIAGLLLEKILHDAEEALGSIAGAVLTVPAYFNDVQRKSLVDAAASAGLSILRVANEPTAAALAYATAHDVRGNVLVFGLTDEMLDVTMLKIESPADIMLTVTDGMRGWFDGPTDRRADLLGRTIERVLKESGLRSSGIDGVILAGSNAQDPALAELVRDACGQDPLHDIDPGEVVARGAAIQAGMVLEGRDDASLSSAA